MNDIPRQVDDAEARREKIRKAVTDILVALGEDPTREGLLDTPSRVAKMYMEVFSGLAEDPSEHLKTVFTEDGHDEIVIVKDIAFHTMCEHHLLPFFGKAHIAYLPDGGRLTGLSKLARVVDTLARRPQLQERLTGQIADAMEAVLKPKGVMVLAEARHMCMEMRGIKAHGANTVTLVSRGVFDTDSAKRAETLALLRSTG
ncbi:GTP cyclohydrolase I FolE [Martelella mangrovi]|uniref:GTP cyclohydrolase 1 n=1 Tax=Martelella mangrovi TaxID=1397477 RepID=A0ABV2I5Y5_9HYPH|nr:GTP cyclohydrolase I FolE [uncultured Martelella sp.]